MAEPGGAALAAALPSSRVMAWISAAARRLCSFLQPAVSTRTAARRAGKKAWQTTLRAPQDAARIRFGLEEAMPPGTAGWVRRPFLQAPSAVQWLSAERDRQERAAADRAALLCRWKRRWCGHRRRRCPPQPIGR